jgi:DNA-binding CsgD family transcriptional regulator
MAPTGRDDRQYRPVQNECTRVELLMLQYASRGLTAGETAVAENKSAWTVQGQIEKAMLKLGARTKTQAVAIAMRNGLIP